MGYFYVFKEKGVEFSSMTLNLTWSCLTLFKRPTVMSGCIYLGVNHKHVFDHGYFDGCKTDLKVY